MVHHSDYRPALSTPELIAEITRLQSEQRAVESLLCRYLADLSDRVDERGYDVLGGFADIYHAARCLFGMSVRRTRECVRIGRALRQLPRIEQAFVQGRLAYARVREVTRVAQPNDEPRWLHLATTLPMRVLERRVAEAAGSTARRDRTADPAEVTWSSPDTVEVRLHLRAETWALLQRAMEGARREAQTDHLLGEGDALEAVARDALARQAAPAPSDLRRMVVLYECATCQRTEVETGVGPIEIGAAAAAALACGATERDLRTEGRIEQRGGPMPAAVARAVRLRDRDRCRVPGCSRRRYVDVHHLKERARGGVHSRRNCLCLCDTHHRLLHEGGLAITGDPEGRLAFCDGHGVVLGDDGVRAGGGGVTQSGSPGLAQLEKGDVSNEGRRLLEVMGRRGGWHVDALCNETGLAVGKVASALMGFELEGRVRRGSRGCSPRPHEPVYRRLIAGVLRSPVVASSFAHHGPLR